jgi:hypothetical protein
MIESAQLLIHDITIKTDIFGSEALPSQFPRLPLKALPALPRLPDTDVPELFLFV